MNRDIIKLLNLPLQESVPHLYGHFFIARRGGLLRGEILHWVLPLHGLKNQISQHQLWWIVIP